MKERAKDSAISGSSASKGRSYLYLCSPSRLRNGVEDWKEITPQALQEAVGALRKGFAEEAWKISYIMRNGCRPALRRGLGGECEGVNRMIQEQLGLSALGTVDQGQTEPAVFKGYFDLCADLLTGPLKRTFSELFEIALSQRPTINVPPVEWAALQARVLVADESYGLSLWLKSTCDESLFPPHDDLYWTSWRAPKWIFMQPFGNKPYDRSKIWEKMDEPDSMHALDSVEDRFNWRLIFRLQKAVDQAHVLLAKRSMDVVPETALGELVATAPVRTPSNANEHVGTDAERIGFVSSWPEVEIAFLSDERIEICCGATERKTYNYGELAFEDRRNGSPNRAWTVLREMARKGGTIPQPSAGKERAMLQKRIEEIRKRLRSHFKIGTDPIPFSGTGYQTSFKIGRRPCSDT